MRYVSTRARSVRHPVDFKRITLAALPVLPSILARWLPSGRREGAEYLALNPRRNDRHPGSFKVNLRTGHWADFAVRGASGRDVVSLAAHLADISQTDAAWRYLQLGWPLSPVNPRTRAPLIDGGFYATTDEATIADWLQRWPRALLATPTGRPHGHIAVDVEIKHPPISGFDTLAEFGWAILPNTPLAHSPSGGLHLHLDPGDREIPTTRGTIGAGNDVCGEISNIFLCRPWDAHIRFCRWGRDRNGSERMRPPQYRSTTPESEERYAPVVTFGSMPIELALLVAALRAVQKLPKQGPAS